ncbi:MAG: KpsF/GutQ family sugar-phosphate isomerase [Alphaproteobacteria bacterium]|nr:KpsF/GutQ family sugar-phosphate isomerase [Alphaproteobacteria bacterium]
MTAVAVKESKTLYQEKGREVVLAEAAALRQLAETLNETFDEAIEMIRAAKGHLIVSGVGKSGHVGKKIAATFASTGQPSFFVHAAEAGHGDLGMVTKEDILLLISYSGEAKELHAIIDYAHRFSIPIISICGKQDSTLARLTNLSLVLPDVGEACPMGLAPTNSTTLTMALGDALAVALLDSRGFSKHDFKVFHPGGNLGQQLKQVSDFMHKGEKVPLVTENTPMGECLVKMTYHGFGCVGVLNKDEKLVGIITDGDLRRHMSSRMLEQTASAVMTKNPVTIERDSLMADAMAIFEKKSITSLFILDENKKVLGLLHIHDCLRNSVA